MVATMRVTLKLLHSLSIHNKLPIQESHKVGCYSCCRIFKADEVIRFTDKDKFGRETGICPYCSIDSLLPDVQTNLSKTLLVRMYNHWFARVFDPKTGKHRIRKGFLKKLPKKNLTSCSFCDSLKKALKEGVKTLREGKKK